MTLRRDFEFKKTYGPFMIIIALLNMIPFNDRGQRHLLTMMQPHSLCVTRTLLRFLLRGVELINRLQALRQSRMRVMVRRVAVC